MLPHFLNLLLFWFFFQLFNSLACRLNALLGILFIIVSVNSRGTPKRLLGGSENAGFRFQQRPFDNAIGLDARVLLETISRVPIKVLLIVVNLNKVTLILGLQLNS